jgi:hypothetical protein
MKNWLRHGAALVGPLAGAALGGPNSNALVAVDLQPTTRTVQRGSSIPAAARRTAREFDILGRAPGRLRAAPCFGTTPQSRAISIRFD